MYTAEVAFRIEYYLYDEWLSAESCDQPLEDARKLAMAGIQDAGADRVRILDMNASGNVVLVIAA